METKAMTDNAESPSPLEVVNNDDNTSPFAGEEEEEGVLEMMTMARLVNNVEEEDCEDDEVPPPLTGRDAVQYNSEDEEEVELEDCEVEESPEEAVDLTVASPASKAPTMAAEEVSATVQPKVLFSGQSKPKAAPHNPYPKNNKKPTAENMTSQRN